MCAALSAASAVSSSFALAQSANLTAGKLKHDQACALCHGKDGIASMANTPHLAGQPEIYLVEQLNALRSGKRSSAVMNVIAKPLTDEEIKNVAAWYATIEIKATVKPL